MSEAVKPMHVVVVTEGVQRFHATNGYPQKFAGMHQKANAEEKGEHRHVEHTGC